MENRDLGWIGLGLGSPKTLFSAKKPWFFGYFWRFPIIWGFPLGGAPRFFILVAPVAGFGLFHHTAAQRNLALPTVLTTLHHESTAATGLVVLQAWALGF